MLIRSQSEIDKKQGDKSALIKLKRQFDRYKNNIDDRLKQLYNLGDDDKIIPLIKEFYEAN